MAGKFRHFSKGQIALFAILGIVVVLVGLWGWNQVAPRPLGDRLEYLGKEDYGNWFIESYSRYYYETNMSQEDIKTYFQKADYGSSKNILSSPALQGVDLQFASSSGNFTVSYYEHPDMVAKINNLSLSNTSSSIVSITSSDYENAKMSLDDTDR